MNTNAQARGASAPRLALSPAEAARSLSLGLRTFERHVLPHLRVAQVGRRTLVPIRELERWLSDSAL